MSNFRYFINVNDILEDMVREDWKSLINEGTNPVTIKKYYGNYER